MEDFVTFEIAKKLKEKGFPQVKKNTLAMYNEVGEWFSLAKTLDKDEYSFEDFDDRDCVCPTIAQALKWLREEKRISVEKNFGMHPYKCDACWYCTIVRISESGVRENLDNFGETCDVFDSYEQAAVAGIEYVLDNLI